MNDRQTKENDCDTPCTSNDGNRNNERGYNNKRLKININCKRGGSYPSDNEDDTDCNNLGKNVNENQ